MEYLSISLLICAKLTVFRIEKTNPNKNIRAKSPDVFVIRVTILPYILSRN